MIPVRTPLWNSLGFYGFIILSLLLIHTHGMPTTSTRALSRFISAIEGYQTYAFTTPSIPIQHSKLLKVGL